MEVGVSVFAGNNFVHGVPDGFEALPILDLADDGGLIDVDDGAACAKRGEEVEEAESGGEPDESGKEGRGEKNAEKGAEKPGARSSIAALWRERWRLVNYGAVGGGHVCAWRTQCRATESFAC